MQTKKKKQISSFSANMVYRVLVSLCLLGACVSSYRVLVALPTTFKSHYQFGSEISKGLAAAGHEVTVISPFKQLKPLPLNYQEVHLELTHNAVHERKLFNQVENVRKVEILTTLFHFFFHLQFLTISQRIF